jgi:hypothetical protein
MEVKPNAGLQVRRAIVEVLVGWAHRRVVAYMWEAVGPSLGIGA